MEGKGHLTQAQIQHYGTRCHSRESRRIGSNFSGM